MSKRERVIPPSQLLVEAEEKAFNLNRLLDAKTAHEQAITTFEDKSKEYEDTITRLDALLSVAREVPPLVTGYMQAPGSSRLVASKTAVYDVRQHVSHVAATAKAAIEVRLTDVRDQLAIARQNLVGINEALAALEQEAA